MAESSIAKADLIFELGTEELPPVALKTLSEALAREFVAGLAAQHLEHGEVTVFAAPRRLALLVEDLTQQQPDREVQKRGPAVQAAFDDAGNPTKAAAGFARSCGTTVDQLERLSTDKGEWLVFQEHQQGQQASELLPTIAETALNRLPIPKRMRWGSSEAQFVRPVHWLLFVLGDQVVDCTILDAKADRLTYGHRFHHPDAIQIDQPKSYPERLKQTGKVIAHFETRRDLISHQVQAVAQELDGVAQIDSDLLDEVTALNEWPVAIAGSFEERFLEVPHEALVTTMKSNQKYFPVFDREGQLKNHFITVANIASADPTMVVAGNERVVRPRLSDAMFFWQQDGKRRLEDHIDSLHKVVFQKDLGSMYEKSQRVADLAGEIATHLGADVALAKRAGLLSRCDLMTEMVYEFPSMQGIMGRYQAQRDGEPEELALAMDEFYMPRFSGDRLPHTKVGTALALAERIDTLVGIFGVGQKPTGDKDPFALRRAALGALRILSEQSLTLNIRSLLEFARNGLSERVKNEAVVVEVEHFMQERLRGLYAERGISGDLFDAVVAVQPDNLADFEHRVQAVEGFRILPEAEALAAANKRIGNLLKKVENEQAQELDQSLLVDTAEVALFTAVEAAGEHIQPLADAGDYPGVLKALATLRTPVDDFFDQVMVMSDDPAVRSNRLALLARLQSLFLLVADIGLIQTVGSEV